jgi:ABC-type uncharacterized transport system permease subunit
VVDVTEPARDDLTQNQRVFPLFGLISPMQFFIGIVVAFIAGALFLLFFRTNPITVYSALIHGSLGSKRNIAETLLATTPLIFGGLAVAVGFRCGLFNMGVEGEIDMGGMAAAYIGYAWSLPWGVHLVVALLGGVLVGAILGGIPGYLKARYRIHEVITTIMLNYIVYAISDYMVTVGGPMKAVGQLPQSPKILPTATLARIWPGTRLSAGIFIALGVALLIWILLFRTRLGYKLRAVGFSPDAAEYSGISSKRMIVLAMLISGGLGGLAGAVEVLGLHYRFYASFNPGYGWDAIAVSLLGLNHPIGVVMAALLFGALHSGSTALQMVAHISKDMVLILSALIIFFTAMNQSMRPLLERMIMRFADRTKRT